MSENRGRQLGLSVPSAFRRTCYFLLSLCHAFPSHGTTTLRTARHRRPSEPNKQSNPLFQAVRGLFPRRTLPSKHQR